ncbi:hypothetical protein FQN51_004878 [Onygenales sp. PD_10]|nr:hypothetical protein FQN51_004878 [Onygenales sp. PD_10]
MASPVMLDLFSFFYPIGNTPAVCLTQDVPDNDTANILLLGCGDARSILYTCYMNSKAEPRIIDYTCCDIQPAVIARNILLFTLLLDDKDDQHIPLLWNLYYHLYLDDKSLKLLVTQVKKLRRFSYSLKSWHRSEYGRVLRFGDSKTLALVRDIWYSYAHSADKPTYASSFRNSLQQCLDVKTVAVGSGLALIGVRSTAPVVAQGMRDLPALHTRFWKTGRPVNDPKSAYVHPNPTLAPLENDPALLHYAIDPLLGFHLATAYIPLLPHSPLYRKETANGNPNNVVEAARLQFQTWCQSFKVVHKDLTLRFIAGDALAFCHTLLHLRASHEVSANLFRNPYHFDTMFLDGEDYAIAGQAPFSFDVIDTSNLADFVGALNVFVAAAPLLNKTVTSTLYTESLIKWTHDVDHILDDLLSGDFVTLSTLIGLFPIQYWTNSSAVANAEEHLMDDVATCCSKCGTKARFAYNRQIWKYQWPVDDEKSKNIICPLIHFEAENLARVLFQVYLRMFANEDMSLVISGADTATVEKNSCLRYNRSSYARFLQFVKRRVKVDWDRMMLSLAEKIETDKSRVVGPNFCNELYTQLHILGVYSVESLTRELSYERKPRGFRAWKNLPSVVSITLEVPRSRLSPFTKMPLIKLGTPYINAVIQSKHGTWQNLFSSVQLAFGQVLTSGARTSDNFSVSILEDHSGWKGKSPLLISFVAPAWILLIEPEITLVGFSLYTTPIASMTFAPILGKDLFVFMTSLGNEANVFITKGRPNNIGMPRVMERPVDAEMAKKPQNDYYTTIKAEIDPENSTLTGFTAHIVFLREEAKEILKTEKELELHQETPFTLQVAVGKGTQKIDVDFPAPVLHWKSKVSIARASAYVEIVASITRYPTLDGFSCIIYPLLMGKQGRPMVWNIPYLNPDCLPIVDDKRTDDLKWLAGHASLMFSKRENQLREKALPASEAKPHGDAKLTFKDSLFSMMMVAAGLQGRKCMSFALSTSHTSLHILIFVSSIRLDLSNHTVVLDAAVIPLVPSMGNTMRRFIGELADTDLCTINVEADELKLWKQALPAFIERCKTWQHSQNCEYKTLDQIPISLDVFEPTLCSCGAGKLPPNFITGVPHWDTVSKWATRALISPCFALPYVEPKFNIGVDGEGGKDEPGKCEACGKEGSVHGRAMLACLQCDQVNYCSSKCQRTHWKVHRKTCVGKSGGGKTGGNGSGGDGGGGSGSGSGGGGGAVLSSGSSCGRCRG